MRSTRLTLFATLLAAPSALAAQAPDSLNRTPVELAEVVVGATRGATPVATVPGAVTVVRRETLEAQSALTTNLGDILSKVVPGFSAGVESPSQWGQSLRGRGIAVLIDGVPQSTTRNVSRDLSTIDPSAVERVEVIRGATAVYGGGATGGVINIITRRPGTGAPQWATEVATETALSAAGEGVGTRVRQSVRGGAGKVDYSLSGSWGRLGSFYDADGDRIAPDPTGQGGLADTETWDLFGKLGATWGGHRAQLAVNHFDSWQRTEFAPDPSVASQPALTAKSRPLAGLAMDDPQGTRNTVVSLDWHATELLGSRVHGQLFYRDYLTRFNPFDGRRSAALGNLFIQSYLESWKAGGRLELESTLPLPTAPSVLWGVDLSVEETSQPVGIIDGSEYDRSGGLSFQRVGTDLWVPRMEPRSLGLFAQLAWRPADRLMLRGGMRHERVGMYIDDFRTLAGNEIAGGRLDFDPFLFNLGAVVDVTRTASVFGAFSQGFSTTDIGLFLRSAPAGFQVGTKTLEPQLVNHWEAGARLSRPAVQASASIFRNQSDLGTSSAGFDLNVVRAPERVHGFEGTLDVQPLAGLGLGGTVSWAEGEFDPDGDGVYTALNGWRIQPAKVTAYAEHRWGGRVHNRLQALWSGDRDRAFEERANPAVIGFGERAVESYLVLDWIGSLQLGPGTLQAGVQNLLNRQYYPVASQLLRSGTNTTYTPARGAVLSVGYTITY